MGRVVRFWHLGRRSDLSLNDLAEHMNPVLRGWIHYYGRYYKSALYPRAPAKSGLDFLTCGDAAQHAGDGRLLGRHGPGDDHEGSSRHLLITKDHARCHHRPRTPSLTSSTRTSSPTYQKHRRRYWPR